jgi:hypothetical protein
VRTATKTNHQHPASREAGGSGKEENKMDTIDFAAEELGVGREELAEALRRGRIRAEREARRRNDGAVEYVAITPEYSLLQAVQAGYVSRLVFSL